MRNNKVFEIQTATSGAIRVSREMGYDDYGDEIEEYYTITEIEGYGELYWSFSYLTLNECFKYLEMPPRNIAQYSRDYVSWWLLRKIRYLDDSFKPILKDKISFYRSIGVLQTAFDFCFENGDTRDEENLLEWMNIASIPIQKFIPTVNLKNIYDKISVELCFDIINEDYHLNRINLQIGTDMKFQVFLNYIYTLIVTIVGPNTYSKEWILINLTKGKTIEKVSEFDDRFMGEMNIKNTAYLFRSFSC